VDFYETVVSKYMLAVEKKVYCQKKIEWER